MLSSWIYWGVVNVGGQHPKRHVFAVTLPDANFLTFSSGEFLVLSPKIKTKTKTRTGGIRGRTFGYSCSASIKYFL